MKHLIASYLLRGFMAYALLAIVGYALSYSQQSPPAWLGRGSALAPPPPPPVEPSPAIKIKTVERVRRDTITIVKIDTIENNQPANAGGFNRWGLKVPPKDTTE
jgi:hypothetical protein